MEQANVKWNSDQPRSQGPFSTSRKYHGCCWLRVYACCNQSLPQMKFYHHLMYAQMKHNSSIKMAMTIKGLGTNYNQ